MIEKLKALSAASTPGPWTMEHEPDDGAYGVYSERADHFIVQFGTDQIDAQLIVAMRNCLPEMLAVVEAAQKFDHSFRVYDEDARKGTEIRKALAALASKMGVEE